MANFSMLNLFGDIIKTKIKHLQINLNTWINIEFNGETSSIWRGIVSLFAFENYELFVIGLLEGS